MFRELDMGCFLLRFYTLLPQGIHDILGKNGQFRKPDACCIVHCRCNGSGDGIERCFTDSLGTHGTSRLVCTGEEYLKLGELTEVDALAVVTSTIRGRGVANATVRLIRLPEAEIIASISYSQPAPDDPIYARHDSLLRTAEKLAREIRKAVSY